MHADNIPELHRAHVRLTGFIVFRSKKSTSDGTVRTMNEHRPTKDALFTPMPSSSLRYQHSHLRGLSRNARTSAILTATSKSEAEDVYLFGLLEYPPR